MPDDVGILAAHHGKQGIRIDRDGGADASAADVDLVKSRSALVHDGRELLFHAERRAAAADITRDGSDVFDVNHLYGFFALTALAAAFKSTSSAMGITNT